MLNQTPPHLPSLGRRETARAAWDIPALPEGHLLGNTDQQQGGIFGVCSLAYKRTCSFLRLNVAKGIKVYPFFCVGSSWHSFKVRGPGFI